MDRRRFLQTLATSLVAGTVSGAPLRAAGDSWKAAFHKALGKNPWLLGYLGTTRAHFEEISLPVEGHLPPELVGVFYRNGPARHEIGDMRYHHAFDGDGMVHAFRFDGAGVSHRGRMVETAKYRREKAAGHALVPAFGTVPPGAQAPSRPDDLNVANISVLRHNGELLALWEGGSAYRLDAETLETLGLKTWSQPTAGAPFSAHPRVDHDGTLWNFGNAPTSGALLVYRISPAGQVVDVGVISTEPVPMVHDFVITDRQIVLLLPPFHFGGSHGDAFLDRFSWNPNANARVLIIDKNNLNSVREAEAPPLWVFHFANGHRDSMGRIRMDAPVYDSPAVMTQTFRDIMRGQVTHAGVSRLVSFTLDPQSGRTEITPTAGLEDIEFPCIDDRRQGVSHRFTFAMQGNRHSKALGFDTIVRVDHKQQDTQKYRFPDGEMAEEHVFVPRPDSSGEGNGWLVGTSLDIRRRHSRLNLFRADRLTEGPIARMKLPYALPLGLHGKFYT